MKVRWLRLPNLMLTGLAQALPYWFLLRPALLREGAMPVLQADTFALLCGATVLTALAGYAINDVFDRRIDAINLGDRANPLPRWALLALYAAASAGALVAAWELQRRLQQPWPLWAFPGVAAALLVYAWKLKCTPLLGNLLVAALCGAVPLLVLLPEARPVAIAGYAAPLAVHEAVAGVWTYVLFAFATTLWREQVKTLEDVEGDAACGCATLPVLRGVRWAKKPAAATGLAVAALLVVLLYFWRATGAGAPLLAAGAATLLLPALGGCFWLLRARTKRHFTYASWAIKGLMLAGMVLLTRPLP